MNKARFLQLLGAGTVAGAVSVPLTVRAEDAVVRITTLPSDTAAEPLYGVDTGIFAQEGLHAELVLFANYGAIQSALMGRAADVAVLDTLSLAIAVAHGAPLQIIAAASRYVSKAPTLMMCVSSTSTIRQPSDLVGQTIAVPTLKNSPEAAIRAWLGKSRVDAATVKLVEVPFPQMGAALERGTVAAATIAEPSLTAARLGGAKVFADVYGAIAPEFFQNVWVTTVEYAQANPDVLKRLVAAIYRVAKWGNEHHAESAAILSKYAKITAATSQAMTRTAYGTNLDRKSIQPLLDAGHTYGFLPAPVTATELIAPAFR